jgi:hypothetical protein
MRSRSTAQAVPIADVTAPISLSLPSPVPEGGLAAKAETIPARLSPDVARANRLPATLAGALEVLKPLRLHVEWTGELATIWVGADARVRGDIPALVASLSRSMERAGARLRRVICNGEVCFTAAPEAPMAGSCPADSSARCELASHRLVLDLVVEKEN